MSTMTNQPIFSIIRLSGKLEVHLCNPIHSSVSILSQHEE